MSLRSKIAGNSTWRCLLLLAAVIPGFVWAKAPEDKKTAKSAKTVDAKLIAACDENHYRHSEGSVTALPDGRWLLAWSRFDGHKDRCGTLGDNGPATIVMAESTDQGQTWSEPRPLPVGTATRNIMQAAFLPTKNGLLLVFSVREREGHAAAKFAIESRDGGKTWSERRKLFERGGANDRITRLSNGRILIAAHDRSEKKFGKLTDRAVFVARSDDEGQTWTLSEELEHVTHPMEQKAQEPLPLLISEPTIAECPDKSLLLLARSSSGVHYESRSKDNGVTWSTLTATKLPAYESPPYLKRLNDGRLALLWNPIAGQGAAKAAEAQKTLTRVPLGKREQLALATSSDGGKTWSEPRVLAEDGKNGYCYPCVLEDSQGMLHVFCSRTPYTIYPCDFVQLAPVKP